MLRFHFYLHYLYIITIFLPELWVWSEVHYNSLYDAQGPYYILSFVANYIVCLVLSMCSLNSETMFRFFIFLFFYILQSIILIERGKHHKNYLYIMSNKPA
jgi:hypothetical protein